MVPKQADWRDLTRLITYLSNFHQASPWEAQAFSPGAARQEIQNLIASPDACVFIHDSGAMGGELSPLRFGKAIVAKEVFWWADRDGLSLLRAFESWALEKNADLICMASLSGSRLSKLYERRGYDPRESFFVRPI